MCGMQLESVTDMRCLSLSVVIFENGFEAAVCACVSFIVIKVLADSTNEAELLPAAEGGKGSRSELWQEEAGTNGGCDHF